MTKYKKLNHNCLVKRLYIFSILFKIVLFCLTTQPVLAQDSKSKKIDFQDIYGYVFDVSGNKLEGVNIYQINRKDTLARTVTDADGFYYLSLSKEIIGLKFERIGFKPYYLDLNMDLKEDEKQFDIVLSQKTYPLPEVMISDEEVILAYKNKETWVYDYVLDTNGIMLLIDNFAQKTLLKINFDQDTILKTEIPNKFNYLLRDAFGNYHLSKKDSMYQIVTVQDSLQLMYGTKKEDYFTKIWPINYINDSIVILKKYVNYNNEIIYTKFDRTRKQYSLLKRVTNVEQLKSALDYINKGFMAETADEFSLGDSAELAANREKFKDEAYFRHFLMKPVYSPLFGLKEHIILFDLESDSICTYDYLGKLINKMHISFHHTKQFKRIYIDYKTEKFYAAFEKSGITSLSKIDTENGVLLKTKNIEGFDFPEDISIYNNEAYFLYRDRHSSLQTKNYLFKIQLYK